DSISILSLATNSSPPVLNCAVVSLARTGMPTHSSSAAVPKTLMASSLARTPTLHGNGRLDMGVRVISLEGEILEDEILQPPALRIDDEARQFSGGAAQLLAGLLEMVGVKMHVAEAVDEIPDAEPRHLRHHMGEQRVGGDVERHAQKGVGGTLVELAAELAIGDVELEQAVA